MKKMVWMTMMVLGMASCQMENESVNTHTANAKPEIVLSCKNGNTSDQLWKVTIKGPNLSYAFSQKTGSARLTDDELSDIKETLENCKAYKIKTKAVSKNEKSEWLSVYISCAEFQVQCVESFNYKLTKKSRKKVNSIRTQLLEMIRLKTDAKTGELAMLADK